MPDLLATFALTTRAVAETIATEPDPRAETPCVDWNYAQLLGHLVGGDRVFAKILTGRGGLPEGQRMAPDSDEPPPTADDYLRVSGRLAEVFADDEVRAAVHRVPVGQLPGDQVVLLRSVEHLLHGWDLAKAAGAPTGGLEPAAVALTPPALRLLAAVGDQTLAARSPFGAAIEVEADASDLDRLVGAFGRNPDWAPDPVIGYERVRDTFVECEDVELPDGTRHGFGANGMRVGGSVFACSYGDRMMIKVPEEEVDQLIAAGLGLPMGKPGQRPMREWVLVPFNGAAARRAQQAYAYARATA